jgi:hypothetical protein
MSYIGILEDESSISEFAFKMGRRQGVRRAHI